MAICIALACACSSSEAEPVLRECPPAPLGGDLPDRCELGGKKCFYSAPRSLVSDPDACNGRFLFCEDGRTVSGSTLAGCRFTAPPLCTRAVVEDATCEQTIRNNEPRNEECLVPDNGQDLDAPEIVGKTCACDVPGPIWRCLRGTFRWTPP